MQNLIKKMIRFEKLPAPIPRFQAHRGVWKTGYAENTLKAFQEAKKMGFEMFECDVQLTKDKVVVCFHDMNMNRIAGSERVLESLAYLEVKELFPEITTLSEVLLSDEVPEWINIEIKTPRTLNESLERRVVELLNKTPHNKKIIFSSFNPISIWKLSNLAPKIPRAFLWSGENDPMNKVYLKEMWVVPFLKIHFLNMDHSFVNANDLRHWSKKGRVALWTVNRDFDSYFEEGVASIITDNPNAAKGYAVPFS